MTCCAALPCFRLGHQVNSAGLLDRVVNLAMQFCGNAGNTTWKNFSGLGSELTEDFGIEWIDLLHGDVLPTAGHLAVRLAEIDAALDGLWLRHDN